MSNPCFDCQKCLGGCSWSKSFTPIPGWDATKDGAHGGYNIRSCPEFLADPPRRTNNATLTEEESRKLLDERRDRADIRHALGLKSAWDMAVDARSRRRHKR